VTGSKEMSVEEESEYRRVPPCEKERVGFLLLRVDCTAIATWKYVLLCMMWLGMNDGVFYIKIKYNL
jgi:hypothetical protein